MISIKSKQSYILDIVVFISGAVVMILELTGSRILAPYVGGSLPVWTALIGVILGCLSLGYMFGGKLADKKPTYTMLGFILFLSAILLACIPFISKLLLPLLLTLAYDLRVAAVLAAFLLFGLPSVLLGMVSPYAIRLRLESVATSGEIAGKLYALSTLGSIMGTFFAGFFLIAYLGSHSIVYILAVTMFILAVFIAGKNLTKKAPHLILVILLMVSGDYFLADIQQNVIDIDTSYSRVFIYDKQDLITKRPIREMLVGNEHSSAMFLDGNDLVYEYTKFYRLSDHFVPNTKSALMVGGAGYSYPKYFQVINPTAKLDVVEIDPALTELAKEHFAFKPTKNTTIYHEDARTFFNREEKRYDVIFNDAFASYYSHPFQLATKESIQHMENMLTPDGVIISNIISSIQGDKGQFLRAEYYTYKYIFPYVYVFPVRSLERPHAVQNIIVVAANKELQLTSQDKRLQDHLSHLWKKEIPQDMPILTDAYAPVEQYAMKMFE